MNAARTRNRRSFSAHLTILETHMGNALTTLIMPGLNESRGRSNEKRDHRMMTVIMNDIKIPSMAFNALSDTARKERALPRIKEAKFALLPPLFTRIPR